MDFSEFILLHDDEDVAALALQRSRLAAEVSDWDLALSTLKARRKLKTKLPSWYEHPGLVYPLALSAEQCSSEETALYKAYILSGQDRYCVKSLSDNVLEASHYAFWGQNAPRVAQVSQSLRVFGAECSSSGSLLIADLTGGMGVDSWAFSKVAGKVLYNEMNEGLCRAAGHNFKALGAGNVIISNKTVAPGSVKEILGDVKPDVIFMDPARRDDVGRKVFMLEDCSPNVLELLPELYELCPRIMLKLSPMADITAVCRQLSGIKEVHVVETEGECKELLLILEKGYEGAFGLFLYANGAAMEIPGTVAGNDGSTVAGNDGSTVAGNDGGAIPGGMLFVPGKGLMKTGAFSLPEAFGLKQIEKNSHLYTGDSIPEVLAPFGKAYRIAEILPLDKRSIKDIGKRYPKAEVTARNIPVSSKELRKRLGVRPSDGSIHIFGTLSSIHGRILIITRSLK